MLRIRPLSEKDLDAVRAFTDIEIGAGYFSPMELRDIFERSRKNGSVFSLVLEDEAEHAVKGVRITFPPGNWKKGKGAGLSVDRWPHALDETAYFQSIFLSPSVAGSGWGGKLSAESLRMLRESGAKGVVCHSWKESPHNSSTRYLQKMGFEIVTEYPLYWKDVEYNCSRCLKPPCQCTAQEMYLDLEKIK